MGKPQRGLKVRRRNQTFNSSNQFTVERLESRMLLAVTPGAEYVPGELLVQYLANTSATERAAARASVAGEFRELILTRTMERSGAGPIERISIAQGVDLATAIQLIERNNRVVLAEPNYIYRTAAISNDSYYVSGQLWGMYGADSPPVGPSGTTNEFGIHAENVWNRGVTGSSNVVIGVIDEGIQVNHPDLVDNIWVNPFEIDGDNIDNDNNGYVDDINGWDFFNDDNSVFDGAGDDHGTHVAGTIGAKGGNGSGVTGVNWNIKMISSKFLQGGGSTAAAVKSIDYLTDLKVRHGINLVATNNSWGGGGASNLLLEAIIRQAKQEILFVAAAGNGGTDNDAMPFYPANFDTTNGTSGEPAASYDAVISVANITSSGNLAGSSQYGATTVDLGAPGSGIWSTVPTNSYSSYDGTSMATPHVAGAIGLLASTLSTPKPGAELKQIIFAAVTPTPALAGKTVTGGRLNVDNALTVDDTAPVISGISVSPGSNTASIRWLTNEAASSDVLYGINPDNLNLSSLNSTKVINHQVTLTGLNSQTTYYYRVRSADAAGNVSISDVRSFTTRFGNSGIITGLTDAWKRINFTTQITNPVVIMGAASRNGGDPVTVRVRNVTSTGFEARIDEWEYQDGRHGPEEVGYIALESGTHRLPDGSIVRVGTVSANHRWTPVSFGTNAFTSAPLVFSQVMTIRENVGVTTRQQSITQNGFEVRVQEEQAADRIHLSETIGWMAIMPGRRNFSGAMIEAGITGNTVTHLQHGISFQSNFTTKPVFLAQMQSYFGGDPATVRRTTLTNRSASIFLEEERSFDAEVEHNPEIVGWLALGIPSSMPPQSMKPMSQSSSSGQGEANLGASLQTSQSQTLKVLSGESLLDDGLSGVLPGVLPTQPGLGSTPSAGQSSSGSTSDDGVQENLNSRAAKKAARQAARQAVRDERIAARLARQQSRNGL